MKAAPGTEFVSLVILAILASGIAGFLAFDKDAALEASWRQSRDERMRRGCESWNTDAGHADCLLAWGAWQRCRRRLPSYDQQLGIICTHPKFRFEERQ
jgi:hypothetical protein